jgi:SHS2 domain-containing protein
VPYAFFDHTGDVGVVVRAPTLALAFADAASALTDTIADRRLVAATQSAAVELVSTAVDLLLVDWLNDLVYRFETDSLLVARADVSVADEDGQWRLRGTVSGESLDPTRHSIRILVKAATYHALDVSWVGDQWQARFVLDV